MHPLSTTWVSLPVRRMGERDQRHKERETFFALLLAGINVVGTSTALVIADLQDSLISLNSLCVIRPYIFPQSFFTFLAACCCSFLRRQFTLGGILARRGRKTAGGSWRAPGEGLSLNQPLHYWLRPIEGVQFRFDNLVFHFIRVQIFQIDFLTLPLTFFAYK